MGMVVRSNIMALNANRQLGMNNSSVAKNLEKLSSGFRINRAGDDASGLAISEKMKAQIKGLDTASANSQDGISLIQTAEGNLTEVHDMLNRMVELAEKSANGTMEIGTGYGNAGTDRNALQDEMDALAKEIDRIADSANFNNIKLLDGSLTSGKAGAYTITSTPKGEMGPATPATITGTNTATAAGKLTVTDANGNNIKVVISTGAAEKTAWTKSGTTDVITVTLTTAGNYSAADIAAKINGSSGAPSAVNVSVSTENTVANMTGANWKTAAGTGLTLAGGARPMQATTNTSTIDFTGKTGADVDGAVFKYDGQMYTLSTTETGNGYISVAAGDTASDIVDKIAAALTPAAGDTITDNGDSIDITNDNDMPTLTAAGGLRLQIGDTSETFNQMAVSIDNMHMKALFDTAALTDSVTGTGTAELKQLDNGTMTLNISDQDSAGAAMTSIKKVINKVSTQRASLGALQNRLEHTINNLDVASENMSAANSRIRDTDMAKQMMEYTKMNVLTQAAQAMLAQANQQPQSILQLLQ